MFESGRKIGASKQLHGRCSRTHCAECSAGYGAHSASYTASIACLMRCTVHCRHYCPILSLRSVCSTTATSPLHMPPVAKAVVFGAAAAYLKLRQMHVIIGTNRLSAASHTARQTVFKGTQLRNADLSSALLIAFFIKLVTHHTTIAH